MTTTGPRQPYVFDLVPCVAAPSVVLSAADGQVEEDGAQGWLHADRRLLSRLHVTVDGRAPVGLQHHSPGPGAVEFRGVLPASGDEIDDPTVFLERGREVGHHEVWETITVTSHAQTDLTVTVQVAAAADLSTLAEVRSGRARAAVAADVTADGLHWEVPDGAGAVWLRATPAPDRTDEQTGTMTWSRPLPAGGSVAIRLHLETPATAADFDGTDRVPWTRPRITGGEPHLADLVAQGLDDLESLLLEDVTVPSRDRFVAAGAPWFLTLFGRDSLWAARMLLPLGTELATETLRVLARRQGRRDDPRTEEQAGRILHEVRSGPLELADFTLPPTYFGTADATQLFVALCAEAWRWGAPPTEVEALLPAVEAGLRWMAKQAGDGFIRYVDATGEGLSNQGWKDSLDSIQWSDGSLATPPIALSEVQAYSYQAATDGADLLAAFDRPGADRWRAWAAELADRFRARFWVEDAAGPYPAVALDAEGRPVDSVASNMGHLLGTGLLSEEESRLVAQRLAATDLDSGFGLRTLTARSPRFSPLSYHGGAVWPHDTAIAVVGLAREGFAAEAEALFRGLLRAAPGFGMRLPELYGGDDRGRSPSPTPYPAACRPQAWAAAAPLAALVALLGIDVDVPASRLTARPLLSTPMLPLTVTGLRVGGHALEVTVDGAGVGTVHTDHPGLTGEENT